MQCPALKSKLEQLALERRKLLQREAEQERRLSGLPHHRRLRRLIGCLGTVIVAIGTGLHQAVQRDQPTEVYVRETERLVERREV
jgi:hypothetical protein